VTAERPRSPETSVAIGVVVPYYQHEAGLLARALRSVAAQSLQPRQVVVVDDGAERPADAEITPQLSAALPRLVVIRQPNSGVAAARNAALAAIAADVTAVAFLDSDDQWQPWHLASAGDALARGADFYFANFAREQSASDAWQETGYPDLAQAEPVDAAPGLSRWIGSISTLMTPGPPFATSTVVYRRTLLPALRFVNDYRRAGEDAIAWWELLTRSSVVLFSRRPSALFGRGVSIWSGSGYGSPAHLERLADEIAFRRRIVSTYPLAAADSRTFRIAIRERRVAALLSTLHLLRRGTPAGAEFRYLMRADPGCLPVWMLALPRLASQRWLGRRGE
jgi:succinoglycan biosynthesis protein ExoW